MIGKAVTPVDGPFGDGVGAVFARVLFQPDIGGPDIGARIAPTAARLGLGHLEAVVEKAPRGQHKAALVA